MAVRKLKPVTPGQRHKIIGTFEDITEEAHGKCDFPQFARQHQTH